MDEAERCHELAYIAYGRLLAHGSAAELITGAHLATCEISGPDLSELSRALHHDPRIRTVAPFGNTLHASASTQAELDAALEAHRGSDIRIRPVDPNLEDIFIALMQDAKDNYAS
jgi:ABC-2 type transport system ATP-binding protein